MGDPYITWPATDGDTVYTSEVSFDWDDNDFGATHYQLYIGSSAGASDYYEGDVISNDGRTTYGVMAVNLTTGVTLYVRLRWRDSSGTWDAADTTYTLSADNYPSPTYARTFDWYEQGRWHYCERCGFMFHESDTAIDPKSGKRVCTIGPNDYDDHEFGIFEVPITGRRDPIYRGEQD
jgi:hypothetical protein